LHSDSPSSTGLDSAVATSDARTALVCYHPTKIVLEARDSTHQSHLILDSTKPSPVPEISDTLIMALNQYDVIFVIR
jgi:hypothetical protein